MSHARMAFKCQVTTAESLAVSVMQEPVDIWECLVARGRWRRRGQGVGGSDTQLQWEKVEAEMAGDEGLEG